MILLFQLFRNCASSRDKPKLSMSSPTQFHQIFFRHLVRLIPSTSNARPRQREYIGEGKNMHAAQEFSVATVNDETPVRSTQRPLVHAEFHFHVTNVILRAVQCYTAHGAFRHRTSSCHVNEVHTHTHTHTRNGRELVKPNTVLRRNEKGTRWYSTMISYFVIHIVHQSYNLA